VLVMALIFDENTELATDTHPWVAFFILWIAMVRVTDGRTFLFYAYENHFLVVTNWNVWNVFMYSY